MNLVIRRNRLLFLGLIGLLFPLVNPIINIDFYDSMIIDGINLVLITIIIVVIIKLSVNPIWIKIDNHKVRINNIFCGFEEFNIDEVKSVKELDGYSFKIEINLLNGRVLKINSFDLSNENKNKLLQALSYNS